MHRTIFLSFIILSKKLFISNAHFLLSEGLVGGKLATDRQFDYQVSIQIDCKPRCGGGIIGKWFIITAAHCVTHHDTGKIANKNFTAIATTNALHPKPSTKRFQVIEIILPRVFQNVTKQSDKNWSDYGDIAVLKLGENLEINSNLNKLKLADNYNSLLKQIFIIAGYGIHKINYERTQHFETYEELLMRNSTDGRLRYAEAKTLSNFDCIKAYSEIHHRSSICAKVVQRDKGKPAGTCVGDSGSPLVYNGIVYGVLNSGPSGCSEAKVPGVYARVSYYLQFIKNAMKGIITSNMRAAKLIIRSPSDFVFYES